MTVQYHITLRDNPNMTYSAIEQFVKASILFRSTSSSRWLACKRRGQNVPLSAEEGFGPYDETKTQTIPTADLPRDAREGDIVDDDGPNCENREDISGQTVLTSIIRWRTTAHG